ncbi:hypothetical protein ZL58_14405 [Salmonella enterica subsp. enterica serovar Typhimurium]|nr:hypothetical protein [Salmonella enterica subsp. enterica serovar Typhimurium]
MAEFDKPMPDYRLAKTYYGDTLQDVANRELGDENRWVELVWLNDLIWPYLTDTESEAGTRVLLTGALIRVPAPAGMIDIVRNASQPGQVYERDIKMTNRRLTLNADGDIAVVAGVKNLTQQLKHRINTPTGQLRRHPGYGCRIHELRGKINGPLANHLAAKYLKASIDSEYRIDHTESVTATMEGDVIHAHAVGVAIAGDNIDLTTIA